MKRLRSRAPKANNRAWWSDAALNIWLRTAPAEDFHPQGIAARQSGKVIGATTSEFDGEADGDVELASAKVTGESLMGLVF